ncbi:aspartic proteinase 39 isoform X2 [Eucalyptus grandis]|uniref:aspartic proteinase 39 isoform X2 n=1 Tax=Eucalyptus grandis TaxID=71139 RepID=UPI00192EA620|nr:aspartic proteinase 39 isoform X2 [Eucalyptus grandis]
MNPTRMLSAYDLGSTGKMDLRRLLLAIATASSLTAVVCGNMVFEVHNKLKGREDRSLAAMRAHDARRHGRLLSDIDLELGGNGQPSETGLYFAKIGIGTPSKDYYVQVDTGSDILWVNCVGCDNCPRKSDLGIKLSLYDPKSSSTGDLVMCDEGFCTSTYNGPLQGCRPNVQCLYNVVYGDGSSTTGYFVKDYVQLDQVTGNLQTSSTNGSVIFGCGDKQSGELGSSSEALDGILGFGQANSSMLSQLASSDVFDGGDAKGTIIDSGTTLAYLPNEVYKQLMNAIMAKQPGLKLHTVEDQFSCFQFAESVDDKFPVVKFHFAGSLTLTVYPHDYLFQIREDAWCFGWMNSGVQSKDGKDMTLLGDLVLSNKLVLYDLETQTIGWTEYNCSSSIKVKDDNGAVYSVGAHELSSSTTLVMGQVFPVLSLFVYMLHSLL